MPANSNPDQGAVQLVAQATNISTGVTLHAKSGQITTQAAGAIANAEDSFVLTNRFITPASIVACGFTYAGSGACMVQFTKMAAGSCTVLIVNDSASTLDAALVINFMVLN